MHNKDNGYNPDQLTQVLTRIETELQVLRSSVTTAIKTFNNRTNDHEGRIRKLESESATRPELEKITAKLQSCATHDDVNAIARSVREAIKEGLTEVKSDIKDNRESIKTLRNNLIRLVILLSGSGALGAGALRMLGLL